MEALIFYSQCKFSVGEDRDGEAWSIMGLAARFAMKMGYHRDPKYLSNISAFDGEMRRRTFFAIETFDLLLSFAAGLPSIIHEEECDTEAPSHLIDEDFDEDCTVLPPSRSTNDPTTMLYFSFKSRLVRCFRRATRQALSLRIPPYSEILKVDRELREVHAETPPSLQARPLRSSFTDQHYIFLNRLNLDLLYRKSLCVLHRKYLTYGRSDETFAYSRKACVEAALAIIENQLELHHAIQPGEQFYHDRWMVLSLSMHDFLLAAMILCLDLYENRTKTPPTSADSEAENKKYEALKASYNAWVETANPSRDTRRASQILAVMLTKVRGPADTATTDGTLSVGSGRPEHSNTNDEALLPETTQEADTWNGSFEDEMWNVNSISDPLETILGGPDNLDWVNQIVFTCKGFY